MIGFQNEQKHNISSRFCETDRKQQGDRSRRGLTGNGHICHIMQIILGKITKISLSIAHGLVLYAGFLYNYVYHFEGNGEYK